MPDIDPQAISAAKLTCPLCGENNGCRHGLPEPCWCAGRPVSKEALESALGTFNTDKTCLCQACLAQFETRSTE